MAECRSRVDIGILTTRDDEFRAVLAAFPDQAGIIRGATREYTLRRAEAGNGEHYTVAALRQVEQGHGEAQDAARDLIEDLAPGLVLVVGIASGIPSEDVKLGDVILSTRIHDFTVETRKTGEDTTYAATGGPIAKALAAHLAILAAREEMGNWAADLPPQPAISWTEEGQLYGPQEWQCDLRDKLARHYGPEATRRAPVFVTAPIASSDRLVADPTLLFPWITTAHNILAVETESGGVFRAARERCPMLAIRGISDVIGWKRSEPWTKFACASAAAFTRAFLRTRPVPLGALQDPATDREASALRQLRGPRARKRPALVATATMALLLAASLLVSAGARRLTCGVPGLRALCAVVGIGDGPTEAEQVLWDHALAQDTEDGLQSYLQRYPAGIYADEARSRLAGCRTEQTQGAIVDVPFDLHISSARPLPTEEEARRDALERGNRQAVKVCEPLKEADQLLSVRAEPQPLDCRRHVDGIVCRADGTIICRVRKLIKSKRCRPQKQFPGEPER
jgi:nucleoside phosphorylase